MKTVQNRILSQRELSVLKLTSLYGLIIPEVVARLPGFQDVSANVLHRMMQRLIRWQFITAAWLYAGRRCYFLTAAGQNAISNVHPQRLIDDRPLSIETKLRRFAMLSFCCLGRTLRTRTTLPLDDDASTEPDEGPPSSNYYVQNGELNIYGFLRVDMGGAGRWDRVVAKCANDARRLKTIPALNKYMAAGAVEITLATALPEKAERLNRAISESPTELPIRIAIIPDMFHILVSQPT